MPRVVVSDVSQTSPNARMLMAIHVQLDGSPNILRVERAFVIRKYGYSKKINLVLTKATCFRC